MNRVSKTLAAMKIFNVNDEAKKSAEEIAQ